MWKNEITSLCRAGEVSFIFYRWLSCKFGQKFSSNIAVKKNLHTVNNERFLTGKKKKTFFFLFNLSHCSIFVVYEEYGNDF